MQEAIERERHEDPLDRLDQIREELVGDGPDVPISRVDTGTRILITLLMAAIWGLAETLLAVIGIFSILFTLVTEEPPPIRLRRFANRVVVYSYRIWRYITYNEARVPFPFSDFPDELEPTADFSHACVSPRKSGFESVDEVESVPQEEHPS